MSKRQTATAEGIVARIVAKAVHGRAWYDLQRRRAARVPTVPRGKRPRCGARCRDGHACQAPVVWDHKRNAARNGRCRMHGGLSTGPRTAEGRARVAEAARRMQLARKAARAA